MALRRVRGIRVGIVSPRSRLACWSVHAAQKGARTIKGFPLTGMEVVATSVRDVFAIDGDLSGSPDLHRLTLHR